MRNLKTATAASLAALALSCAGYSSALAQTSSTGTSTNVTGRDIAVGTYGSGETSPTGLGVTGGGYATAADGGTAATDSSAKLTERRAKQTSTATAQDEDERARARTRTTVRKDGDVRSRSHSVYKADGERAVVDRSYSTTAGSKP
ncbi:MAG: hypothetical protein Q8K11_01485 [Phenylobacterium sp.]|uniref:hypothetical protein n=1 Tax=Phenylobacterium sp. TaxID=1871053 RepID=UPI002731C87D|nr:hypothetical protein [Phenylobacterium sp.]MDP2008824.1 hypothetical protein [Phenylobacterium sp.]